MKGGLVILFTCLFSSHLLLAQSEKYDSVVVTQTEDINGALDSNKVHTYVGEWPHFVGGQKAMIQFISENIHYPLDAEKLGIEGRVIVAFTIKKTGVVKDVYVIKSVYPSLDEEAKRVVELMPPWVAGKNEGVPVNVKFKIDIVYKIPEKENNQQGK